MKRMFLAGIAAALMALPAAAQNERLKAHVPFGFFAGDTEMAAGEYTTSRPSPHVVLLRSVDWKDGAMLIANSETRKISDQGYLVFNKYPNDRYFLAALWYPGSDAGLAMNKSRREREQVSSMLISGVRPERVFVMLTRVR